MVLCWDLDLSFGKTWDGGNSGVYHDRLEKPGINPWYTTRVQGGRGNWLLDGFFFEAGTWFRRAYLTRLYDAVHEKYTEEFFLDKIAGLRDLLIDEQEEDIPRAWDRTIRRWYRNSRARARTRAIYSMVTTRPRSSGRINTT